MRKVYSFPSDQCPHAVDTHAHNHGRISCHVESQENKLNGFVSFILVAFQVFTFLANVLTSIYEMIVSVLRRTVNVRNAPFSLFSRETAWVSVTHCLTFTASERLT